MSEALELPSRVGPQLLKPGIGLLLVGGALFTAGISAANRITYLAGVGVGAVGLAIVALVVLWRFVRPAAVRWPILIALPLIMVGAGLVVPQLLIGRPDSRPLWQAAAGTGSESRLVGDRLYLHSEHTDQVLDAAAGRTLLSVPALDDGLTAGADGSFVQYEEGRIVYRGPDGGQRWSRQVGDRAEVIAIADGWVVLDGCPKHQDACGIAPDGRIGWRQSFPEGGSWLPDLASQRRQTSVDDIAFYGRDAVEQAPAIAVHRTSSGIRVFDTAGHPIDARDTDAVAVGGELVITADRNCQLSGYRAGQQVFGTDDLPCGEEEKPSAVALFSDWLYLRIGPDHVGYAVHLTDGQVQRVGAIEIDNNYEAGPQTAFPGEGIVVRRDRQQLTGIDPASGRKLWSYVAGGDRIPGIGVENGAVTVLSALDDRTAALAGIDPQRSPKLITVLDALSGEPTGHRVITGGMMDSDGLWSSDGIGPGRALVVIARGDAYAIGRG